MSMLKAETCELILLLILLFTTYKRTAVCYCETLTQVSGLVGRRQEDSVTESPAEPNL